MLMLACLVSTATPASTLFLPSCYESALLSITQHDGVLMHKYNISAPADKKKKSLIAFQRSQQEPPKAAAQSQCTSNAAATLQALTTIASTVTVIILTLLLEMNSK